MAAVRGVNHITFAVGDLARSFEFYVEALGCTPVARWSRGAYLDAGGIWLALVDAENVDVPSDYSHIAFSCSSAEFAVLSAAIDRHGGRAWSTNRSEGESYYFVDPDGRRLELHVGDLASRLAAMRADPWEDIEFFD